MKLHCCFSLVPTPPMSSYPLYISHQVKTHVTCLNFLSHEVEIKVRQRHHLTSRTEWQSSILTQTYRKREPKISFPMVHVTAWMTYVWKTMFLKCGLRGQVVIKYDCKLIGVMRTFLTSESILVCVKDKQVFICI